MPQTHNEPRDLRKVTAMPLEREFIETANVHALEIRIFTHARSALVPRLCIRSAYNSKKNRFCYRRKLGFKSPPEHFSSCSFPPQKLFCAKARSSVRSPAKTCKAQPKRSRGRKIKTDDGVLMLLWSSARQRYVVVDADKGNQAG